MNGLDLYAWLNGTLEKLPTWPNSRLDELLPLVDPVTIDNHPTRRCFPNLIRVKGLVACTLTTVDDNAFQSLILSPTVPISDQHFQPIAFND